LNESDGVFPRGLTPVHPRCMGEVLPLPSPGDVFTDVRCGGRTMRVSYHADRGVVVVSLWAGALCRASFRLGGEEVDRIAAALAGMRQRPGEAAPPDPQAGDAAPDPAPRGDTASPEREAAGAAPLDRSDGTGTVPAGAAGPVVVTQVA
jgi:hypothetical protein